MCIDILARVDFLKPMASAASDTHARYDGGGDGGRTTWSVEAHIVAVADAFDAMTSTRSYRRALAQEVAFAELRDKAGSQFNPDCVEALMHAIERRGEKYGWATSRTPPTSAWRLRSWAWGPPASVTS